MSKFDGCESNMRLRNTKIKQNEIYIIIKTTLRQYAVDFVCFNILLSKQIKSDCKVLFRPRATPCGDTVFEF